MNISTLEQYMAQHGYVEVLVYNNGVDDAPDFSTVTASHIIKARGFSLTPRFTVNGKQDVIMGQIDHNIFLVNDGEIKGELTHDLAIGGDGLIEHPIAMMYQNMRNAWIGMKENGEIISPKDEWAGGSPWFALGSTYHGQFTRCLVDSFELNATSADAPIQIKYGIVALRTNPNSVDQVKLIVRNGTQLVTEGFVNYFRNVLYGRSCVIEPTDNTVYGHFGMPDAKGSIFSQGINAPGDIDTILRFNVSINNNLKPVYTTQSREIADPRVRFQENLFPSGYVMSGQRVLSGTIEWYGSANPITFIERILGPGSVQNRRSFRIRTGNYKIEIADPVWDVSEKNMEPQDRPIRRATFVSVSDGIPIVPYIEYVD